MPVRAVQNYKRRTTNKESPSVLVKWICILAVIFVLFNGQKIDIDGHRLEDGKNKDGTMVHFQGFNEDLIPANSVVDVNIGTNRSPFPPRGRHRILVDPLFFICEANAKLTQNVTAFCFAVSDYTGFATFYEYNTHSGVSSSLSKVSAGTSHEKMPLLSKRTVLVLEASVLFSAILAKHSTIHRLKLDMQGHELSTFRNLQKILKEHNLVTHIFAECFCPNKHGKQIYQVDNSCQSIDQVLQEADYETTWECPPDGEYTDITAYKKGMATQFENPNR